MVFVVRGDLKMGKGKVAAQVRRVQVLPPSKCEIRYDCIMITVLYTLLPSLTLVRTCSHSSI